MDAQLATPTCTLARVHHWLVPELDERVQSAILVCNRLCLPLFNAVPTLELQWLLPERIRVTQVQIQVRIRSPIRIRMGRLLEANVNARAIRTAVIRTAM